MRIFKKIKLLLRSLRFFKVKTLLRMPLKQGWNSLFCSSTLLLFHSSLFRSLLFHSLLFCSLLFHILLKEQLERFALVALYKKSNGSDLLHILLKEHQEQFAPVALFKEHRKQMSSSNPLVLLKFVFRIFWQKFVCSYQSVSNKHYSNFFPILYDIAKVRSHK